MGSACLLELFHEITSRVRGNQRPFGGIQTILVGDWLQLNLGADKFDDESHLFASVFPHTIKLTIVHGQNEREARYRNILSQLRLGRCDDDTVQDITDLKRELDVSENVIHLYFTNLMVDAQGLTLQKAVIHSAYEFTGGLPYTALSRVKSIDDVQVVGFKRGHVCNREMELRDIDGLPQSNIAFCPCFREVNCQALNDNPDVCANDSSDAELLEFVQSMFAATTSDETDEGGEVETEREGLTSMEEVLETLDECEHVLSKPPDDFDIRAFLISFKGTS